MGIIESILNFFFKKKPEVKPILDKPQSLGKISGTDLRSKFKLYAPDANIILTDIEYDRYSIQNLRDFLSIDLTDKGVYVSERHDCDDFAKELLVALRKYMPGICAGEMFIHTTAGGHAVVIFLDETDKMWQIEPQSDSIRLRTIDDSEGIYFLLAKKQIVGEGNA